MHAFVTKREKETAPKAPQGARLGSSGPPAPPFNAPFQRPISTPNPPFPPFWPSLHSTQASTASHLHRRREMVEEEGGKQPKVVEKSPGKGAFFRRLVIPNPLFAPPPPFSKHHVALPELLVQPQAREEAVPSPKSSRMLIRSLNRRTIPVGEHACDICNCGRSLSFAPPPPTGYGLRGPTQGTFTHAPRHEKDGGRVGQGLWASLGCRIGKEATQFLKKPATSFSLPLLSRLDLERCRLSSSPSFLAPSTLFYPRSCSCLCLYVHDKALAMPLSGSLCLLSLDSLGLLHRTAALFHPHPPLSSFQVTGRPLLRTHQALPLRTARP